MRLVVPIHIEFDLVDDTGNCNLNNIELAIHENRKIVVSATNITNCQRINSLAGICAIHSAGYLMTRKCDGFFGVSGSGDGSGWASAVPFSAGIIMPWPVSWA